MELNVGLRSADAHDPVQEARVPVWLAYPTRASANAERFGPYTFEVARDAAPEGEGLPLVVVSHGTGGSPWVYRDLAAHLARAGFVVALIEHPGNNRNDDSLAGTRANLENRPRHLRLAIDAASKDRAVGARLAERGVGVIGHSMGGYTALAVAGGRPSTLPHESPDGRARPIATARDPRVRALVLLTPATVWYAGEGALSDVDVAIWMRTAEKDVHAPPFHGDIVANGVRDRSRVDYAVIPGAGHFAFLTPFPAEMARPEFPPSQDPDGFDRRAFLPGFYADVERFLRRSL